MPSFKFGIREWFVLDTLLGIAVKSRGFWTKSLSPGSLTKEEYGVICSLDQTQSQMLRSGEKGFDEDKQLGIPSEKSTNAIHVRSHTAKRHLINKMLIRYHNATLQCKAGRCPQKRSCPASLAVERTGWLSFLLANLFT